MKDEALKLALEALEEYCEHGAILRPLKVRDTIKQALAAPVQEPAPENFIDALKFDVAMRDAAQQEYERGFIDGMQRQAQSSVDRAVNAMSQRQWVGLTDEERDDVLDIYITAEGRARAIEAKLKEKNNG
jgi:hypothetical protein